MKKTTTVEQMRTALSQVKSLIAQAVNAAAQDIAALTAADVGAVPTTRKVNNKALSADITLSAADVGAAASGHTHTAAQAGAVPTSRKVNGKALSTDISLSAADVGALASSGTAAAATKLAAARTIRTNLASTAAASFNGTANVAPGVSGTLPISSGGTSSTTAAGALNALGAQAKAIHGSLTIPVSGWGSDSTAGYPKYYDIAVSGVTASDRASVDLAPASAAAAVRCGLCPTCETLAGKIRIRANSVPAASMTANYWIEKGS